MLRGLMILAALLVPVAAHAEPSWQGVWQGTIGKLPVRACLQQRSETYRNGSYYYLNRMKPIPLRAEDDGSWSEEADGGAVTGKWRVESATPNGMTGTWRSGARTLPIVFTRVASDGDDGPCGSDAYIAPRLRPVRITTQPASKDGFAYTVIKYDVGPSFPEIGIASFSYPATRPGDRAINVALRVDPREHEGPADYVGCMKMALTANGRDGDFGFSYAPALVTPEFLSVAANSGGFCGGAHPSEGFWHLTFDRVSGKSINLANWFTPRGIVNEPSETTPITKLTPALRPTVLKHYPFEQGQDADCKEVVATADYWDLSLTRRGIGLTPSLPHVAQACRMISADAAQFPDEARSLWRDGTGTLTLHLAEWIESAINRGQLRHDDPHFMAELLISMIGGQDFDRQRFHMPHRDDAGTRRRWAGFSVDSFLRAFAPAASVPPHSNQLRSFS